MTTAANIQTESNKFIPVPFCLMSFVFLLTVIVAKA